jgi:hypothetical protein
MYTIPSKQIELILIEVQKESGLVINVKHKISAIIDGGSVVHSRGGNITVNSLNDLITISKVAQTTLGDPLVVIHKRHLKTIPNLEKEMQKNGISYYLTPHLMNDDLFILNFFLLLETKPYIITNDMYRDHIFKFEKSKGIKFGLSQFKDVVEQQTISFDIPLTLKYRSDMPNNTRMYVLGGVRWSHDFQSNQGLVIGESKPLVALKANTYYYEVGAGMEFRLDFVDLSLELKMSNGLNNALIRVPNSYYSGSMASIYPRLFSISLMAQN